MPEFNLESALAPALGVPEVSPTAGLFQPPPLTWWHRVVRWLFPVIYQQEFDPVPEGMSDYLIIRSRTKFSLVDRLRILASGRLATHVIVRCHGPIGPYRVQVRTSALPPSSWHRNEIFS